MADYQFTKRFDVYGGTMYSRVFDGLASGFRYGHDNNVSPMIGARFNF